MAEDQPLDAAQLKFRVDKHLRDQLAAAAKERGVSLNKEIADRLWRSLLADKQANPEPPLHRAIGSNIIETMNVAGHATMLQFTRSTENMNEWINHPAAYNQAFLAAVEFLDSIRPQGPTDLPPKNGQPLNHNWDAAITAVNAKFGELVAQGIIGDIVSGRSNSKRLEQLHKSLGPLLLERMSRWYEARTPALRSASGKD